MSGMLISAAAGWVERIGLQGGAAWLVGIALGLALLFAFLFFAGLPARRRRAREVRELVRVVEAIRDGRARDKARIDAGSSLSLVADAVNRLGQDVESRVREAEKTVERLRAVQDGVRDSALVTTDTDGDILSFSQGAVEMFGWQEEEVISRPASMLFDEGSYQEFLPKLARRALRERGVDSRAVLQRRDGSSFEAEISVRMVHGAAREAGGFVLVVRDVTRQAGLERELRTAEQRYRALVEGLVDGVLIVRDGRLIYANPAFAELCGMPARELEGSLLRDRVDTRELLYVEEALEALQRSPGETTTLKCRLLGADAATWFQVTLTASAVDYLGYPAVLLLVRDESAQRRIHAELRRNESRLDAVLESTSDGILLLAEDQEGGVVQLANRAFAELLDLRMDELLGASLGKLVKLLGERGGGARTVAGLLAAGGGAQRESVVVGGRSPKEIEVSVASLSDQRGASIGRVLACRDLTEQRESQRKLQQHAEELQLSKVMLEQAYRRLDSVNRDLHARTAELDRLNQELRTLDEMKSNLLGNVSHELQTPLVSIRGYTEMILKERLGPISEEQRKGLGLCLKNIDRLISMIDNLLAFTRSEPEMGELRLSRFRLRQLIEEAGQLLQDKIRQRSIRFSLRVEPADLAVQADRDKILQVFINLVSNAVKFNRQGGQVEVSARPGRPGFVEVLVEDTGVGIPPDALDRVFERNYQVGAEAMAPAEGSGIGLSIVRDILRLHGCRIAVQSEEERGTKFSFTLPASTERTREVHPEEAQQPPVGGPPVTDEPPPQAGDAPAEEPPGEDPPPSGTPRPRFRIIRHYER